MSYSQEIKNELCNAKHICSHCLDAMLYGMLLMSKGVTNHSISLNTENKAVADFFAFGIVEVTAAIVTVQSPDIKVRNKRPIYTITVEDQNDIQNIIDHFFEEGQVDKHSIQDNLLMDECCVRSFLRGAYCVCGAMINPIKEYHLEFSVMNQNVCEELIYILQNYDLDFKMTTRGKNFIAYIKESQQIEDALTCFGAIKSSMNLMNLMIEKELRNTVNRRTNCETANIDKTVNASMSQIANIELIMQKKGLDSLPIELKEVAILRLENPDMSLSELCALSNKSISRSGLNHRLKKICSIAEELKNSNL